MRADATVRESDLNKGSGAHYTITTTRNPRNKIGNNLGLYITVLLARSVTLAWKLWVMSKKGRKLLLILIIAYLPSQLLLNPKTLNPKTLINNKPKAQTLHPQTPLCRL